MARNLGEGAKFSGGHGFEQDIVAVFFDTDFGAFETKGAGQTDGLAASMLKDFSGDHSYI
jgi:hypothetical protein